MVVSGIRGRRGSSGRWQLTVNSQLPISVNGPRHSVKGHHISGLRATRRGGSTWASAVGREKAVAVAWAAKRRIERAAEIAAREGPGAPQRHQALAQLANFRPLLPTTPTGDGWRSVGEALARTSSVEPGLEQWARAGVAYRAQDPASFNRSVADLTATAALGLPCEHLIFDDEGHEIRRMANRAAFVTRVVAFLSAHVNPR